MQRDFAFHACLGPEVNQADVLHMCGIPQLLDAALSGYNVTVFAYGQTGVYFVCGRDVWIHDAVPEVIRKDMSTIKSNRNAFTTI